ncbi:SDR family NAD(P)-dependent oxidoreductase, partial [bacterium]|nr:SDR family NAD(P)-dependent oxidoreductase [bacterium]
MNVLDMFSLKGKVALVTGGAGLYGRQIVAALAEAGAETYIASRNRETLEAVSAEHRKLGHTVTAFRVDQGDEQSVIELRDTIKERSGRLDVLVNNAVARPMKDYNDDVSTFAESMRINATGLFVMTRVMGDFMPESTGGSIIN